MEKLLTTASSTSENGKAGANAHKLIPGVGDFFSEKRCLPVTTDFLNFFRECLLLIIPIWVFGLWLQNHLSDPDAYALLEYMEVSGL